MSSAASNYDVNRLMLGIALAFASVASGATAAWGLPLRNVNGAITALIALLYAIMMFASSYVEEEQHFWYWITGGWVAYLSCLK
jgi:ethanolaminephosphotransferase